MFDGLRKAVAPVELRQAPEQLRLVNQELSTVKAELDTVKTKLGKRTKPKGKQARAYFDGSVINELNANAFKPISSPNQETAYEGRALRAASRALYRNSPIISNLITILKNKVIGYSGFTYKGKVLNSKKKIHNAINDQIAAAWQDYCKAENLDVSGRYSLNDFLKQCIQSLAIDGEILVRRVYGRGKYNFQVQLLDVDCLYGYGKSIETINGNTVYQGVEVDQYNKPVFYHVVTTGHPSEGRISVDRLPASEILHAYEPNRIGAARGIPWTAPVIAPLEQLHGYRQAEVVAARVGACSSVFYTTTADAAEDAYAGTDDSPTEPGDTPPAPSSTLTPGTAESLPPGVDVKTFTPSHPNSAFESFQKAILKEIGAGLKGISYNTLIGDYESTSYSSMRSANIAEKDLFKNIQAFLLERILEPIFNDWLEIACATGKLNLPPVGGSYDIYKAHDFVPNGFEYVDPYKDAQAQVMRLDAGLTSRTKILGESGEDYETLLQTLSQEKALEQEYGISFNAGSITAPTAKETVTNIENQPDNPEKIVNEP